MSEKNIQKKIQESFQESILNKIQKQEIVMTSKKYFFWKWVTMFVVSLFFLGLAFYIFAYITFLFVDNGLIYMPLFTVAGLVNFIVEIPWTLVFLGLLSVFLFSKSSKTFYGIYRKPFLTFFFTILIIIMISHILFVETGAMKILKQKAYENHLQLVPDKFLQFRNSQTGSLIVGKVYATSSDSVILITRTGLFVELNVENILVLNNFLVSQLVNAYVERVNGKVYLKSVEIVE